MYANKASYANEEGWGPAVEREQKWVWGLGGVRGSDAAGSPL